MADAPTPGPAAPEKLSEATERTFSRRAVRWLFGIGVVSLVATLLLSVLTADREPETRTEEANSYSFSAVGHRAFAELLRRLDVDVTVSRHRSVEKAGAARPLLVLEPAVDSDELSHLEDLVAGAAEHGVPMLVALPKWRVKGATDDGRWATDIEPLELYDIGRALGAIQTGLERAGRPASFYTDDVVRHDGDAAATAHMYDDAYRTRLIGLQTLRPHDALEPEVMLIGPFDGGDTTSVMLVARIRGTSIHLVSDPDILNTMGLGEADHAKLAVALVTRMLDADAVVIDEMSHGFERVESIWEELFAFPLVLLTLHVAGLLALALWAAMARFGKPEPRPPRVPSGKQTLLDNTATLLALGHHAGYGAKRYFDTTLRALARTHGIAPEVSEAARVEQLAAIAARRGREIGDLRKLATEVAALADRGGVREEHRAKELARRIYKFRKELADGHRSDS